MKKASVWCLAACFFLFFASSCARVGPLYIEVPEKKARADTVNLHFFFDKTESIQGFTAKGDDSQYVQTLPLLWQVGNNAFFSSTNRFFDYGTEYTNEFIGTEALNYVRREVLRRGFYESLPTGGNRQAVHRNGGQPFTGVAEYIKTLNEPGSAFIVITDLYEQNRENPFFLFFRDAFSRGLSGALFAVESNFSGRIHSFSLVDNAERFIQVRDGIATFFICIIGDIDVVYEYCAELARELSIKRINFHNAVFMLNPPLDIAAYHSEPVIASNVRRYSNEENEMRLVNLRLQEITIINQNTSLPNLQSYQVLTNIGSRWTAGLALKNINPENFKYTSEFSLSYFDGRRARAENDAPSASQFIGRANSSVINTRVHVSDTGDYPVFLVLETNNRLMDNGWYKINSVIIPEAILEPDWVTELNAGNISALEQSANTDGGRVLVLEFANFYEKIASAYNAMNRTVYSDDLYLIKR